MKEILNNIALVDLINFCKEKKIDPADTQLCRYPRKYTFALVRNSDRRAIATITYYKNQTPFKFINN